MKKILFLFVALIMSVMGAWAQAPDFTDLVVKEVKACTQTIENGKWYVISNVRKDGGNYATPTPVYDQGAGSALKREPFGQTVRTVLAKNKPADAVAKYLVRFDNHPTVEGTKCMQFGTGNYVAPYTSGDITTSASEMAAVQVYGATQTMSNYAGSPYTNAGVGFNFSTGADNYGLRWDGNGASYSVLTWGSGKITSDANNVWYVEEVVLGEIELLDFTVSITGAPAGTKITYNGHEYGNGDTIEDVEGITVAEVSVPAIDGYNFEITINGTNITVTYVEVDTYAPTFNILTNHTNANRQVSAIKLGGQSITINGAGKVYQNLTESESFTVEAGETVTPAIVWNGVWMHGMVYIDTDASDHVFTAAECVSHTALTGSPDLSTGFSSFVAPAVGDYRMRYKVDWATLDPNGASDLIANGGYVLDVMLHVVAPPTKADVTYEVYQNDVKLYEEVKHEVIGGASTFALPERANGLVTITSTLPTNITEATTVRVEVAEVADALPFKTDGTLYNLALNRNPRLEIYVSGEDINTLSTSNAAYVAPSYATQNFYKWALEGDWYHGFNIKNAGAAKYVSFNSVSPDNKTKAVLVDTPNEGASFEFRKNGTKYYFRILGTTNAAYISNNGGAGTTFLTNWNSENNYNGNGDAGAQFIFAEAVELPAFDWAAYENRLNQLKAYPLGDGLGQYADVEKVDEALGYSISLSGWIMGFEYDLEQEATEYYDDDMEIMQWFLDHMSLNMPQKGQMLFIKTSSDWISTPTFLYNEESTANAGRLAFNQPADEYNEDFRQAATWIYDGQYLVNYANGLTASNNGGFMNIAMYPSTTKVEFLPAANGAIGKYNIRFASSRYLYTNNGLYTDAGSNGNAEGYNFELGDATYYFFLDFGSKGWASGYFPIPVAANPEYGIDAAYYIKNDPENNCFQAEPVGYEGHGLIAPFTPVIIKVNSSINGGRPLVKGAPDYTMQPEESALSGALWKQATPANCCVFNVVDGKPGFYGYTGTTLKHSKAYYVPSTPAESVLRINFGEEDVLTGIIEAIEKEEFSGNIFDLQGRRINGVQQGVFVKDGKKVIK